MLRSESGKIAADEDGLPVLQLGGGRQTRRAPERRAHPESRGGSRRRRRPDQGAAPCSTPRTWPSRPSPATTPCRSWAKPLVRLVFTGSEVVAAGIPQPGEVRDTFGPQLAGVVEMLGGICAGEAKIGDSYAEWLAALEDTEPAGAPEEADAGAPRAVRR